MHSTDNFKRPEPRRKPPHVDNFLAPHSPKGTGSISFDNNRTNAQAGSPAIDNFSRPDGFNPPQQPTIALNQQRPRMTPLDNRPRNRSHAALTASPPRHGHKVRRNWKQIMKRTAMVTGAMVVLVGGFLGYKLYKNTSKVFNGNIFGLFSNTKLKGEDKGRVNIMITGTSEDDPGHSGAMLTDSIMIASIDPVNNTGFLISVPRDLWVDYGTDSCSLGNEGKINAVYECGEDVKFHEDGFPDGGVGLMEKVIERDFGLDINYYVKINYTAFRDAVNSVGGIDVTIKTNDSRGLYDGNIGKWEGGPLKLPNGNVHLDGQTALNLARARCDTVCYGFTRGDFDRTEHQRMMLLALKDKALSVGTLSNPAKISSLLDSVGNNVKTDFQVNELRRLYDISKQIQNQNLKSVGLADDDVKLVTTANINGTSAVRPVAGIDDFSQIKSYLKRLTSNDPVAKEGATVVVLNGSNIDGLARKKADELAEKGITVKAVATTTNHPATIVATLNNQKTATSSYLGQKFGVAPTTDTTGIPEASSYNADFVIILGANTQQ
jgi:LCP family protein required for cell wall assembly